MAETLRPRKVPEERILITGHPRATISAKRTTSGRCATSWGIPRTSRSMLALAGAYLPRPYVRFRDTLDTILPYLHSFENLHLAIVAGNDEDYARHLRSECTELGLGNVTVFDYVERDGRADGG